MITTIQFKTLDDLYDFYNRKLFDALLPNCIVNMSRHAGSCGFFASKQWRGGEKGKERVVHEISLNPDYLDRPFAEWHSTLVHEMVHLWQEDFGHTSRAAYHSQKWAGKMEQVGLIPSSTGEPGGKRTGQAMSHYIDPKGMFNRVFKGLGKRSLEALRLKYLPAYAYSVPVQKKKRGNKDGGGEDGTAAGDNRGLRRGEGAAEEKYTSKKKYTCPCGNNVLGRPGLKVICGDCGEEFEES
jgi:predicted SprT family Zn-dependent metalloprotease